MRRMPELPEVQTIVSQLQRVLPGQAVASVSIRPGKIFRTGGRALKAALPGRRIERVARHGKRIIIELSRRAAPAHSQPLGSGGRSGRPTRASCRLTADEGVGGYGPTLLSVGFFARHERLSGTVGRHGGRPLLCRTADGGVGRYVPVESALVVHLGMTGGLLVVPADGPVRKHTHLRVRFVGQPFELRFVDPRRFGGVWLVDDELGRARLLPSRVAQSAAADRLCPHRLIAGATPARCRGHTRQAAAGLHELGPDALTLRVPVLRAILRRRRRIKALLLDQQAVSGLGNIYCDEALFAAGIHPLTRASDLNERQVRALAGAIRRTLRASIASGGTTVSDYRDAGGNMGGFQRRLRVYGREDEPCPQCGSSIRRILAAGRSTHLCPRCQPRRKRSGIASRVIASSRSEPRP
jgi:formamidopyrimidine-DNA glycosylase